MTPEKIYLITIIGSICDMLNLIALLATLFAIGVMISGFATNHPQFCAYAAKAIIVALIAFVLACLVPSKKDLAAMYVLPYIEKNADAVCQLPDELAIAARAWLKNEATR